MAHESKNILIFGGTGVIGKYLTQALLDAKASFDRIAIITSKTTVEDKANQLQRWKTQGLEVITGDLTKDDEVLEAYKDFDTVISAVGRNVIAEQISLLKLAEASPSIKTFYPSEYGTDIEYYPESAHEKPHQQKLKVRAYIRDNIKRLNVTYLVTGPYADIYIGKAHGPGYGTFDAAAKKAVLLGDGNGKISLTTMEDVGRLLVAALKHPDAARNKVLKVNSFTTTPNQILREYERQTGGEKWETSYTSLSDLRQSEAKAWENGNPLATLFTLRRIWTEGGTLYDMRDNETIGAGQMDSLEKAVGQAIKVQS
ncbi:hypothetical protein MBLNU459_g4992t1 [Dothideomycetes sp. NU459]